MKEIKKRWERGDRGMRTERGGGREEGGERRGDLHRQRSGIFYKRELGQQRILRYQIGKWPRR